MRIRNVYRPDVFGCQADEPLTEVAQRMMEKHVGSLAVLDDGRVIGIITRVNAIHSAPFGVNFFDPAGLTAAANASTKIKVAHPDEDSQEVAKRMLDAGIRHLPVEEHGRMVGMVSMRDLLALETWAS